jgi:hypothetical protein
LLPQFSDISAAAGGEETECQFAALLRQPPALVDHGLDVPDRFLEADDLAALPWRLLSRVSLVIESGELGCGGSLRGGRDGLVEHLLPG